MQNLLLYNIHTGEVLPEDLLLPLKISAYRLSKDINMPEICKFRNLTL
jgi:hypothetical protein